MSWHTKICVAVAIVLAAAACGVGGDEQAQIIEDVQYELLGTSTSTTSTTVVDSPIFTVFFYWHTAADNRLQVISRQRSERPSAGQTLTELVMGPLPEDLEANPDLVSRLDQSMEPRLSQVEGSTYQIQIQWPAEEALTTEQATELVCAAVQFVDVEAVTIVNADLVPFTLSGAGAVPIAGPARGDDFGGCVEVPLPVEVDAEGDGTEDQDGQDAEGTTTTTS